MFVDGVRADIQYHRRYLEQVRRVDLAAAHHCLFGLFAHFMVHGPATERVDPVDVVDGLDCILGQGRDSSSIYHNIETVQM